MVHQIDHSPLTPNPALGAAIEKLSGRKLILTNGTREHADAVLDRLGIGHHFEAVFDIRAAELEPKPRAASLRAIPRRAMTSIRTSLRCSRISRAIWKCLMRWA